VTSLGDRILTLLRETGPLSARTVAYRIGCATPTVRRLVTSGELRVVGYVEPEKDVAYYQRRNGNRIPIVAVAERKRASR
jgi:DNA-binding IclR family transcriptional regulator